MTFCCKHVNKAFSPSVQNIHKVKVDRKTIHISLHHTEYIKRIYIIINEIDLNYLHYQFKPNGSSMKLSGYSFDFVSVSYHRNIVIPMKTVETSALCKRDAENQMTQSHL